MSSAGDGEDGVAADEVVLEITDASSLSTPSSTPPPPPIPVSALTGPLPYPAVAVRADRSRLIESSSYFRALLGGSFSESGSGYVQISCNLEAAVQILRYLFEPSVSQANTHPYLFEPCESQAITHENFLLLLEGALFLAVENLLVECEIWFRTMISRSFSMLVPLDFIIEVWDFAQKHGVTFVEDDCPDYLAKNFVQVISSRLFAQLPYDLLCSIIECPYLIVDSEKQLCEAILHWLSANMQDSEQLVGVPNSADSQLFLLSKVKVCLLPLGFAAGTKRNWVEFGNNAVCMILNLLKDSLQPLLGTITDAKLNSYRIRLTNYSKKVVLSGCPQLTTEFLYVTVLPTALDAVFKRKIASLYSQVGSGSFSCYIKLVKKAITVSFPNVRMVDLSKCPNVHFGAAIDWLKLVFPELRTFRASHCLHFQFEDLQYLLLRFPSIKEVDLSIDMSIILPKYSVISSRVEARCEMNRNLYSQYMFTPIFSKISKLTLEGRNDITDKNLLEIFMLEKSLCYINIKHCTLLTDDGISTLLLKCTKIHSMVLSYTSFGNHSIQTLCSLDYLDPSESFPYHKDERAHVMASRLQQLHLEGCEGISCAAMSQLLSNMNVVKSLCLRQTSLTDGDLCNFVGSSLEYLDLSETVVSMVSLAPIIRRNSNLSCLKTAGCRNLLFEQGEVQSVSGNTYGGFLQEITNTCCLEDVEMGWAFCPIRIDDLIPSFSKIRRMTVGLGTTLPENILHALPEICPFLESLVLRFQVISDMIVRNLLESSINLQVLCLHYCLGGLTSFSFQAKAPALRILRLQWVTPWMTNDDLTILTQNCNLVELSLSGCKLLDSTSQEIISSGWPNLTCLHLEECGQITLDGLSSILNCKALEDVLLRHTGRGIGRTIITDATRELPLLRLLALDLCDASDGGYDTPNDPEGKMLRSVRMSRCKSVRSCLELHGEVPSSSKPVHKETIVLEWSSSQLRTTVLEERV